MNANAPPRLVIGLTGGIASGKSTVGDLFRSLGVSVIDADEAAREVVAPGTPCLTAIRAAFGEAILDADGRLDRARLRERVFADPQARRRLEQIVHPAVRKWMDQAEARAPGPYVIRMVPLLVETGQHASVDRVLVVDCDPAIQRARAMSRDNASAASIDAIIAAQASRAQRLAVADDVIVNNADRAQLRQEVQALHERYLEFAARLRPCPQQ